MKYLYLPFLMVLNSNAQFLLEQKTIDEVKKFESEQH